MVGNGLHLLGPTWRLLLLRRKGRTHRALITVAREEGHAAPPFGSGGASRMPRDERVRAPVARCLLCQALMATKKAKKRSTRKSSTRKSSTRKSSTRKSSTRKSPSRKSTRKKSGGRKYGAAASKKVGRAMHEAKRGKLRSGSGKKVTSKKQAIAIGLSQARRRGAKVPKKKSSGRR